MDDPRQPDIDVDGTLFSFPAAWLVSRFDEWSAYRDLNRRISVKGCDLVALDNSTLWLIEVKDYSYPGAHPPRNLAEEVGLKCIGTMAVLYALARSQSASEASAFAAQCHNAQQIRVALHINVRDAGRPERTAALLTPLQHELKRVTAALGLPRPRTSSNLLPNPDLGWHATRDPQTRHRHSDR